MKARDLIERLSAPAAPPAPAPTKPKPGTEPAPRPAPPAPKRPSPWRDPNVRPGTEPKPKAGKKEADSELEGLPEPGGYVHSRRANPPYA